MTCVIGWTRSKATEDFYDANTEVVPFGVDELMNSETQAIVAGIAELARPEGDDQAPSEETMREAFNLIEQTAHCFAVRQHRLPKGYVTTDGVGGIRIEWWDDANRRVSLAIGATENDPRYLFVRSMPGEPGRVEKNVSAWNLYLSLAEVLPPTT